MTKVIIHVLILLAVFPYKQKIVRFTAHFYVSLINIIEGWQASLMTKKDRLECAMLLFWD